MKSVEAFESITVLKNKFEEIKNNILNIEKDKVRKLEEFQTVGVSAKRYESTRPASTSKLREYPWQQRNTQSFQNDDSVESFGFLKKQIQELQEANYHQALAIENLKQENSQLKTRLEEKVLTEKSLNKPRRRPQSCLRQSSSSPKRARVAFAPELTKVQYITSTEATEQSENENQSLVRTRVAEYLANTRLEYDTPPKITPTDRSRSHWHDSIHQLHTHSSISFNTNSSRMPHFFRERSLQISKNLLQD